MDRLFISTQEIQIDDNLEHIINDDLYNFTNDDMNLTGELFIDEFRTNNGYDVLYWEAKANFADLKSSKYLQVPSQGPKSTAKYFSQ